MRVGSVCWWARIVPFGVFSAGMAATAPPGVSDRIEQGLEQAVEWKWNVAPPASDVWGMPLPEPKTPEEEAEAAAEAETPPTYEVKKGDVIIRIARKHGMSAEQLMRFNEMESDLIRIGDVLRIPTREELLAMAPPPVAKPVGAAKAADTAPAGRPGLELPPTTVRELELQTVLFQVFLDREMFSQGPIDGDWGPVFEKTRERYLLANPHITGDDQLRARALEAMDHPYTGYVLKPEDFRFIEVPGEGGGSTGGPSFEDLSARGFLAYASAWEFIAERFHCDEAFLRSINPHVEGEPAVGTTFQVPNVVPFEIENALDGPLQPEADPKHPVTAEVVGLSRLEISRGGKLVALLPLATARPGLSGRGTWIIRDAVPRPRMVTRREPREAPDPPDVEPENPAEYLAPGPNNPAGVIWIHLAKARADEPLRYGLHGTSIPGRMGLEGIGGFRLANWDIARAVRLLPSGTPLTWRAK